MYACLTTNRAELTDVTLLAPVLRRDDAPVSLVSLSETGDPEVGRREGAVGGT